MFIPDQVGKSKEIVPTGNTSAKIALVGDWTSGHDLQAGKPFQGYAGNILDKCLHNAGLIRGEVYLTNLIKERTPSLHTYFNERTGTFTERGMYYVNLLAVELREVKPNIVVACGAVSFAALCSLGNHSSYRGYIFPSTLIPGQKVITTHDPGKALRGMYIYQYLIAADLKKAKSESEFPEIVRPERELVYKHDTCQDALDWLDYYVEQPIVGFDIEVLNYEVSCISFASDSKRACVIPLAGRWEVDEELQIWRGIQKVLGNPNSIKVIQNSMFDVPFLLTRAGIVTRGPIHDTMIAHSILYPELNKGLGFLGSLYCGAQEYWKDTVKFKNIKQES